MHSHLVQSYIGLAVSGLFPFFFFNKLRLMTRLGLYANAWRFLYFILMLFVLRQTMNGMTMLIWSYYYGTHTYTHPVFALLLSATVPAPIIASLIASSLSVIFILFSGFVIIRTRIVSFWKFGPYISPIHYIFDGLALNELHDQAFTCTSGELLPPPSIPNFAAPYPEGFASEQVCRYTMGDQFLADQALSTHWWHRWGDLAILFFFWLLFSMLLVIALRYISFASFVEPTGTKDVSGRLERVRDRAGNAEDISHAGARWRG